MLESEKNKNPQSAIILKSSFPAEITIQNSIYKTFSI